jgi:hypothetical protein
VRRALTDFTDRRLQIWSRTLDPKTYELREQGDTWAVARESTPGSPFWVVSRYDWSDPDVVRWAITESSYWGGGEGFARVSPSYDGGSRLHVEWSNTHARQQKLLVLLLQLVFHHGPMRSVIASMWPTALDGYAAQDHR